MKSVGEIMAIGRTFKESIQKGLCSLETGLDGFEKIECSEEKLIKELRRASENRILYVAEAFRRGMSVDQIYEINKIDKWFLYQIKEIVDFEKGIDIDILSNENRLRVAKTYGFSDKMIAKIINQKENTELSESDIYMPEKG